MKTTLQRVEAEHAVSVSDFKKRMSAIVDDAEGMPVAVLNHNKVMAYIVPADTYEAMIDRLDDLALVDIIASRANEEPVPVALDEL